MQATRVLLLLLNPYAFVSGGERKWYGNANGHPREEAAVCCRTCFQFDGGWILEDFRRTFKLACHTLYRSWHVRFEHAKWIGFLATDFHPLIAMF